MTKPKVKRISFDTNAVEIIPGLQVKSTPNSSCLSKKASKLESPSKIVPAEPTSSEIDFSSFKSVNPVTQLLYTRYRNARKRLNRIESHEVLLCSNSDHQITDEEKKLLTKKEETSSTVRELYTILPQVAELCQKNSKELEEQKFEQNLRHLKELEQAVQNEKERSRSILLKTISLFTALLQENHHFSLDLLPEEKNALNIVASKILSPSCDKDEFLNFLVNFHDGAKLPEDISLSADELSQIIEKTTTLASQPKPVIEEESIVPVFKEEGGDILSSLLFLKTPGSELPCDDDFDSPSVIVKPFTIVPAGGIFFLNPSEIYPGEPRALFKTL